jgi:hypothetical protein
MQLLTLSHEMRRKRLSEAILVAEDATEFAACVPVVSLIGPRALATACALELAFIKTLVEAPDFCEATKPRELNATRAVSELVAFSLDRDAEKSAAHP